MIVGELAVPLLLQNRAYKYKWPANVDGGGCLACFPKVNELRSWVSHNPYIFLL